MNGEEKIGLLGAAGIIGILADWTDVLSYCEGRLLKINIKDSEMVEKIIFWIALVILVLVVINSVQKARTHRKLCDAGTRGIPCTLDQYKTFRSKNKTEDIQNAIHRDLYHCVHSIKLKLKKLCNSKSVNVITIEDIPDISLLLQHFHATLYKIYNIDASISIYSVSETSEKRLILTREMFLRSKDEEKMGNRRILRNKYLVAKEPKESIEDLTKRAQTYHSNNGRAIFRKNSVFDFILSNPHNSWLSNDLSIDCTNKRFFTSSENYGTFYNSLAAFAILPPESNENRDALIKGILTFDTVKTGLFLEKECITVMGLMAHFLNEILESLKMINNGNEKTI